jgi:isoleucyl-tRNA synthetase
MDPSKGVDIEVGSQTVHVPPEALDTEYEPLPDTSLVLEKDLILVLEIKRDAELIREGYVRDVARRIQYLRKEKGYNPTDVLPLARIAGLDEEMANMLRGSLDRLAFLVRVQRVEILREPADGIDWTEVDLDERKIHLSV